MALSNFSNNKFSRKDALKLQKNIAESITRPIRDEIKDIINEFRSNDLTHITNRLENIASFCEKPFEGFDTEYKFIKTLKNLNLYESPSVITLNNSISSLVLNHVNTMDEVGTKGVLLPIKFHIKNFLKFQEYTKSF